MFVTMQADVLSSAQVQCGGAQPAVSLGGNLTPLDGKRVCASRGENRAEEADALPACEFHHAFRLFHNHPATPADAAARQNGISDRNIYPALP